MDQICPKRVFPLRNKKSEHQHWILHIWISLSLEFHLELTILIFWIKFAQTAYARSKTEKWISPLNSACSIYIGTKFQLQLIILIFWNKFAQTGYFRPKTKIWISLTIEFYLELTILIFWTKFPQKVYSQSKAEKVDITIEFCMFELV